MHRSPDYFNDQGRPFIKQRRVGVGSLESLPKFFRHNYNKICTNAINYPPENAK